MTTAIAVVVATLLVLLWRDTPEDKRGPGLALAAFVAVTIAIGAVLGTVDNQLGDGTSGTTIEEAP